MRKFLFFAILLGIPSFCFATFQLGTPPAKLLHSTPLQKAIHGKTNYPANYTNRISYLFSKGKLRSRLTDFAKMHGYQVKWLAGNNDVIVNNLTLVGSSTKNIIGLLAQHYPDLTVTYAKSKKGKQPVVVVRKSKHHLL